MGKHLLSALAAILPLTSCATSMEYFATNRYAMEDLQVCESAFAAERNEDQAYIDLARTEIRRRGLSQTSCQQLIDQRNQTMAAVALVGLAVVAIAASADGGGGGGYTANNDYQWDWDAFRGQYGRITWRCRGLQTGRFAETWRCNGLRQDDDRWPG
jgi:hypothetical protein